MLSLNTNMMALTASRYLAQTESALAVTRARLASGLRINSARDDAAGLAISERLLAQIRGTDVAARNANVGISMAEIGESAAGAVVDALQRMSELATEAATATADRALLAVEFGQLQAEVADLVSDTAYDGTNLLNNTDSAAIQVGPNAGQTVTITNIDLSELANRVEDLLIEDAASASAAITSLTSELDIALSAQASWGAVQNRFENVVSQLESSSLILTEARGRIVDADMAAEASNLARLLLLQDSTAAMLAQANAHRRQVLSLLLS